MKVIKGIISSLSPFTQLDILIKRADEEEKRADKEKERADSEHQLRLEAEEELKRLKEKVM